MAPTKSRGRRAQKKATEPEGVDFVIDEGTNTTEGSHGAEEPEVSEKNGPKSVFFGLVDSNEIDYFKQAESTLNTNAFDSPEDRQGFVTSVLEEAKGKELKLVTNQICSKLMERLLLSAKDSQVKAVFKAFHNHFVPLAYHKYSSHVLETLLKRSAAIVEKELIGDDNDRDENASEEENEEDDDVTMEHLFLQMLKEIHPSLQEMIEHQYASHVTRLLILIIAGKELPSSVMSNSTLRSKKSKIARKMIEINDIDDSNRAFQVPPSFKNEIKVFCDEAARGQDTKRMRELAIHKIASPVVQLLLQVEGIVDKERTIWHKIFLKETDDKDAKEESFVEYLLSDSVGSHFLESLIKNTGVRLKYIERLYKLYMKERIFKLSKRATSGVFVVQALLFKLKPVEIQFVLDQIIPELSDLVSISENQNLELCRNIIDASIQRHNYRRDDIIEQLFIKFAPNKDEENTELLENLLQLRNSTLGNTRGDWPTSEERRRSLLLEKFMEYDYSFVVCVWRNFLALPPQRFIQMSTHGVFSHVVEKALVVDVNEDKEVQVLRKRLLNLFQGEIINLACNSYGSHIVDELWKFTVLLNMYKDRIGTELASDSHKVKESTYGRLVWKNWSMELFVRKKYDWKALIKQQEEDFRSLSGTEGQSEKTKKPIELKMEQLYKERQGKQKQGFDLHDDRDFKKQKLRGRRR